MSQAVSEYVNYIKERGECIERAVELDENIDAARRHNPKTEAEDSNTKTPQTGRPTAGDRCYRLAVACVLLLCFLLLTATTALWIKFSILNTEKDQLQTTYNTLITERDQLQVSYNKLNAERQLLNTRYMKIRLERDQLQDRNDNLTLESEQQQATIEYHGQKIELLLKMKDELHGLLNTAGKWRSFSINSSIYYVPNESKTWDESRKYCMDRGADLVIINSTEEWDFIGKQLDSRTVWIGLTDSDEEGNWKWVDGTPVTTAYWSSGEPNDKYDEDCAEIYNYSNGKLWNDAPCSRVQNWICEKRIA